jgi:Ca2+-binding EF-hand superfamily protein
MKRILPLVTLLLFAPLSASVFAQSASTNRTLDVNRDGVIDRTEAASHPRLAAHFDHLDRNHDGRLTADERRTHAGKRGGKRSGLARFDADRDGRISRAEFDTALAGSTAKHPAGRESRKLLDFTAIDANRDGHIVRAELRAYRERMRPQREAERKAHFEEKFAAADLNRDGRLGRVEVDEKMPRLAPRFEWMDENRDGFLNRDELRPQSRR